MPTALNIGCMAGYSFVITEYSSFEDEVLQLRNANRRNEQKTRKYLDWRYATGEFVPHAKIFWVISLDGERVGMASLIFRRYWVDGEPMYLAVLGDISLNEHERGKGVGQELLRIVSNYITEYFPKCTGFVMPNQAAERSLAAVGWTNGGKLTPFVLLLDPSAKALAFLKLKWLAACCVWPIRLVSMGLLWLNTERAYSMSVEAKPDESLDKLWQRFPKSGKIIRDRSTSSLAWRFAAHPDLSFKFAKFVKAGETIGYLVFELSGQVPLCTIYEILVVKENELTSVLASFAMHCAQMKLANSIRIVLNDEHPYANGLWKLGFVARPSQGVFQVFNCAGHASGAATWMVSAGDKDI